MSVTTKNSQAKKDLNKMKFTLNKLAKQAILKLDKKMAEVYPGS